MLDYRKMMRLFPKLLAIRFNLPVQHYPDLLLENLHAVPAGEQRPAARLR